MRKFLLFVAAMVSLNTFAQVSHGGTPFNWEDKHVPSQITFVPMPVIALEALQAEEAIVDQYKEAPFRFGYEHETDFSEQSASWFEIGNGKSIWQLGIHCPDARSINLLFENFNLPKGSEMFIWSNDREEYIGSFNHLNNHESGVLATTVLQSSMVVVEVIAANEVKSNVHFNLTQVVHGYRPVLLNHFAEYDAERGPYGSSGSCNNNVNCAVGSPWQTEKKSVALILEGGSAICTGALVNNTANDGTPYFLTANHCYGTSAAGWVFVFNHETAGCTGNTGPTNQTVSGASLKAKNAGSDFCLLLLNSTPPAAYNVQYAGWDASDANTVSSAVCIHHPSGDLKKISFENNAVPQGAWGGAQTWDVQQWDDGITEPGSSGSPLFDQNHRIIGQLFGGGSACSGSVENGQGDSYGRFGVSWDAGSTAATRLKEWLDPQNSGQLIIDGYPTGTTTAQLDAAVSSISGVPANICASTVQPVVTLVNNGSNTLTSCTIQYTVNGGGIQTYNWTGSLAQYASTNVTLPVITLVNGANNIVVTVLNPNNGSDENANNNSTSVSCNAVVGASFNVTVSILADDYPEETTWSISQGATVMASGDLSTTAAGGVSNTSVCLAPGCYNFIISDSYGDGICCAYGNGSYTVTNPSGQVVASGGQFADSETTNFCLTVGVEEMLSNIAIYPNPANDWIQITGVTANSNFELFSLTGQLLEAGKVNSSYERLEVGHLENGIYQIRISGDFGVKTLPLVIKK